MTLEEKLDRIESLLVSLLGQGQRQEWYATDEFARRVGRSEFTIRQWCRQGRIEARSEAHDFDRHQLGRSIEKVVDRPHHGGGCGVDGEHHTQGSRMIGHVKAPFFRSR